MAVSDRAPNPPSPERRDLLGKVARWTGLAVVAELLGVLAVYLWPSKGGAPQAASLVVAGPVADFAPSSVRAFPAGRFYLVRLADGGFLALSSRCTHLGCSVPWDAKEGRFPCPCHASVFDLRGEVLSPPAPRPLDLFPVLLEGGIVKVDTSRRIERTRFEPGQVAHL